MQTLLITNPESVHFLTKKVKSDFLLISEGTNKRIKNKDLGNKSLAIIKSQDEFDKFDFAKFKPEVILIVPELLWSKRGIDEGYEIATEILTNKCKKAFFQLVFLSVVKVTDILTILGKQNKNRSLAEVFPHIDLLDEKQKINFRTYSEVHFQLIKSLLLSNKGRLDMLEHNYQPVVADLAKLDSENLDSLKTTLINGLEELELFQTWTEISINSLIGDIKEASNSSECLDVAQTISKAISDIKIRITDEDGSIKNLKENYKLLFIEDELSYRELFAETFSAHFDRVAPDKYDKIELFPQYDLKLKSKIVRFNIEDSREIIKTQAKHYDVFVLDLLYKDKNGRLLAFNGLDIYLLVKEYNPYAVIRIVTGLPREVIGKVVNLTINQKIPLSHVFSKKHGKDALKINLVDRIEEIVAECKDVEETKSHLFPIPGNGIFSKSGMKGLMIMLLTDRLSEFEMRKEKALELFELYSNCNLTKETNGWEKGVLGKGTFFSKPTEAFFIEKIVNIMVYRLIAIDLAQDSDYHRVYFNQYKERIKTFSKISDINNEFFYSIGFGLGNEQKNEEYFTVSFTKLLPHESTFIAKKNVVKYEKLLLHNFSNLQNWIYETIIEFQYVKTCWHILKIKNFDWYKKNFNTNEITISQVQIFFANLYSYSMEPLLTKIIKRIQGNEMSSDTERELQKIPELMDQIYMIFDKEIDL